MSLLTRARAIVLKSSSHLLGSFVLGVIAATTASIHFPEECQRITDVENVALVPMWHQRNMTSINKSFHPLDLAGKS